MKKVSKLVLSILMLGMFTLPAFAATKDTYYYIENITVKAFQQWNEAAVYDMCYGPFLFVRLYNTGNEVDTVEFKGMADGVTVTTVGTAKEGATYNSRVNFTDGQDDNGRWLTGINFRSAKWNLGQYSINGIAIY
ncbi:MAG: hypothetical protein MR210_02695 [Erysipelotrichaceae bacterium]|nr:hypothetical protein [Erysipelotrichaceae bacterium]MDY5252995.1 hypothetical protein [Erysipelotrichaceae bacterium]